jgi:PAS domain S-box-containing protein
MNLHEMAAIVDPARLAQLEALHLREESDTAALDRLTRLAADLLNVPASYLSLIEADRQIFLSQSGLPAALVASGAVPLEHAFCAWVVADQASLVATDARLDPRLSESLLVTEYGLIAYAGVPVTLPDGPTIGSLCAVDTAPRAWTDAELRILEDLAVAARTILELHTIRQRAVRAEIERDTQKRFVEQVFEAAPDIVYIYDVIEHRNLYSNQELIRVLGYQPGEVRDMEPGAIVTLLHPDDLAMLQQRNEKARGSPPGTVLDSEYRIRHADGVYRWLHSRETVLDVDENGGLRRLLGVAQDVTRRRQIEAAQRETVQRLTLMRRVDIELMRTLDLQGALTVAMDAALRVTNASDAFIGLIEGDHMRIVSVAGAYERNARLALGDGVIGRAMQNNRPELIQNVASEPAYIAYLPGTRAQMILPLVYRDRAVGVMVLDSRRLDRLTPDTFEFMKLIIDRITVSIENALLYQLAQDRLAQVSALYDRVRQLEQLKTDMIRLAAHDLRSPLNVVMMHADLLLEDETLEAERRRAIGEMRESSARMNRIVGDILSLQRIEAMDSASREPISLARLIEAVCAGRAAEAEAKEIVFEALVPGSLVVVEADSAQLREAVDNLVGNALKYTPNGGTVTVRLIERGGQAVVEVEDTGPGIPDELQPRLFTPFFRARTPETAAVEGTGLGLHLVRNIVERHNGRIRFHSTYGRGSMFGFEIPSVRTGVLKPVS